MQGFGKNIDCSPVAMSVEISGLFALRAKSFEYNGYVRASWKSWCFISANVVVTVDITGTKTPVGKKQLTSTFVEEFHSIKSMAGAMIWLKCLRLETLSCLSGRCYELPRSCSFCDKTKATLPSLSKNVKMTTSRIRWNLWWNHDETCRSRCIWIGFERNWDALNGIHIFHFHFRVKRLTNSKVTFSYNRQFS